MSEQDEGTPVELALCDPHTSHQVTVAWNPTMRNVLMLAEAAKKSATVPSDTKPADDTITVELLERWGGEKPPAYLLDGESSRRFITRRGPDIHVEPRGGTWCVDFYTNHGSGWKFLNDFTSATDLRKLLELLGCELKGE